MLSQGFINFVNLYNRQDNRNEIGKELHAICENVKYFFTDGVLNYQSSQAWGKNPYLFAPDWFRQSLEDDFEEPTKISFLPKKDAAKARTSSIAKFLSFAKSKMGLVIEDKEIELYSTWAGRYFVKPKFSYIVVSGGDILEEYYTNYHNSCMYEKPQIKLYSYSPPESVPGFGLEQVICMNEDGTRVARALLWNTDQGKFMDRIYPSDQGVHTDYMKGVAEKNGWDYKSKQTYSDHTAKGIHHLVKLRDVGAYTYFDTMRYQKLVEEPEGRFVYASNSEAYLDEKVKGKAVAKREGELLDTYLGKILRTDKFRFYPEIKDLVSDEGVKQLFRKEGGKIVLREDVVKSAYLDRFFDRKDCVQLTHGKVDYIPSDYPYLIRNDVGSFVVLRKDLDWTDEGWVPGSGKGHDSAPVVEYRGLIEEDYYFCNYNSRRIITKVKKFWAASDPDSVMLENARTAVGFASALAEIDVASRPTAEEIENFTNVAIRGDLVQLREEFDGTAMSGQIFPAGTVGLVEIFHEESDTVFVRFPATNGGNATYWHSVSNTLLRRIARPGDVIPIPVNADTSLQGRAVSYNMVEKESVVLRVGGIQQTYTLPALVRLNLFGAVVEKEEAKEEPAALEVAV